METKMQFNVCKSCEAKDGRAGVLINGNCLNCHDTLRTKSGVSHTNLIRTPEELQRTFALLK